MFRSPRICPSAGVRRKVVISRYMKTDTALRKGHLAAARVPFEGDHLGHEPEWGMFSIHEIFRVVFIASIDRVL